MSLTLGSSLFTLSVACTDCEQQNTIDKFCMHCVCNSEWQLKCSYQVTDYTWRMSNVRREADEVKLRKECDRLRRECDRLRREKETNEERQHARFVNHLSSP